MYRKRRYAPFLGIALLLIIASTLIAGCSSGSQNQASTHPKTAQATPKKPTQVVSTSTPTATVTPGATVTETGPSNPVPTVDVSWTTPSTMYTLMMANVRAAPSTGANIVATNTAATAVTVYGTAIGDAVYGNSTWDRVSDQNSSPQYILSTLLGPNKPAPPPVSPPAPSGGVPAAPISTGKVMFVNLTNQHLYAYQDGTLVNDFLITSGRPELMTPTGTFTVLDKGTNLTFYSPWPPGSPYYYSPEFVPYALRLTSGGIFIHAAPWREAGDFGPGTQYPHTLPDGTQSNGSHGCINTTTADAAWSYNWAPIGMTVVISY